MPKSSPKEVMAVSCCSVALASNPPILALTERIDAVYKILQNLSELSYEQQCNLRKEMTPILEHNANIFYYKLKNTVINELTTNLKKGFVDSGGWDFVQNTDIAHLNKVLKY